MYKMFLRCFCLLLGMGILFSCGGGSTSQGSSSGTDPITIKISHPVSDTDPTHLGFIDFKNHIEDTSKGRFKVELYPNKQLANSDVENLELLVRKSIEITFTASSGLATQGNIRDYFIYDYPYFFQSDEIVLLFS